MGDDDQDRDVVYLTTIQPGDEWVVRNEIDQPVDIYTRRNQEREET